MATMKAGTVVRRGSAQDTARAAVPAAIPFGLLALITVVSPNLHRVTAAAVEMICEPDD
ncbi:hypothetical protein MF406_12915 [Georgenia sp. TF02-10]|uniref:hypothetical protein n=1 Tax=Georgenia sp. TF02-10 TaxID=2917725 RepID=UPI001FA79714|nr:hypothetical protein [Georgenia sp. TF02-10]UNX53870.1 hypothetical protein MF406_12915 [Georgenia sp. TF02-10]